MQIIHSPDEMQQLALTWRQEGRQIHFVPTMGALHAGHLSLMERARSFPGFDPNRDRVVASIFVNPTQFNDPKDLAAYPHPIDSDTLKCRNGGVSTLFLPSAVSIYPEGFQTEVTVKALGQGLCGRSRPGHFDGVATVVLKLFMITQPHRAFFGEKDFQQLAVIKRLVHDLKLPLTIIPCPTVREPDGLAMSSRNSRLSAESRQRATILYQVLQWAKDEARNGKTDCRVLQQAIVARFSAVPDCHLDYAEFVHAETLEPLHRYEPGKTCLALAAFFGTDDPVRLIDNIIF